MAVYCGNYVDRDTFFAGAMDGPSAGITHSQLGNNRVEISSMADVPVQNQMGELERLAHLHFLAAPLSEAEIKLVRAAETGGIANCARGLSNSEERPASAEEWGPERQVRAVLIRWLCVDPRAKLLVDPLGVQLWSAQVQGSLDLSFVRVPFPLAMVNCRVMREINLQAAEVPDLNLTHTSVPGMEASGIQVKANVFLRSGFSSAGEVRLLGARIGGDLDCRDANFVSSGPIGVPGGGFALSADRIEVANGVFLNSGFRAEGEVRFPCARVGGNFSCSGGSFINPARAEGSDSCALGMDGMVVDGEVSLNAKFNAEGGVRLLGAQISGNLDCSGARLKNPAQAGVASSGKALTADGVVVKGCIFFTDDFAAEGDVELLGAHIEKNLECIGSTFQGQLGTRGASIGGGFHWLGIKNPELTTLLLDDTSASRILDDAKSWPPKGNLDLDGFVYQRITEGPRDRKTRLKWLARQADFTPQPYRQLARVLRDEGNDWGARRVLYKMEVRRRKNEDRYAIKRSWSTVLRYTIGYGYHPGNALAWLVLIVLVGWPLFRCAYFSWNMAPTDKDAYQYFHQIDHPLPASYDHFCASVYSLEKTFPLVKLGQVDRWQPDPSPPPTPTSATPLHRFGRWFISAGFLTWFGRGQTVLGWILATLFAAGVAGVVRKD